MIGAKNTSNKNNNNSKADVQTRKDSRQLAVARGFPHGFDVE
jgi:hypothetical protein